MILDRAENGRIGHEVHFGAAVLGVAGHEHRRHFHAVHHLEHAILRNTAMELHEPLLAVAAHGEAQPARQRVHARHAHAVQAAGHLVAVLVELAAGVQLRHHDFSSAALRLVLVVHLHVGRNPAAVVGHGNRVVGVNRHVDVVAVPGQRFVDRVVEHLEHEVVQTGAVRRVADVHPGALAHRFQTFEDLDRRGAVAAVIGLRIVLFTHGYLPVLRGHSRGGAVRFSEKSPGRSSFLARPKCRKGTKRAGCRFAIKTPKGLAAPWCVSRCRARQMRIGITTYLNSSFSGTVISALELASPRLTCTVSTFRFASTSSRYVTLKPMSTVSPW